MPKKVLFAGCSFTENCGFLEQNLQNYHWPWLFSKHYKCYFVNVAVGGLSNQEIFCRTMEALGHTHFDLVVVMWSSLNRRLVYFSENNVDDFTIINHGFPKGFKNQDRAVQDYARLHYKYFDNSYVDLKQWLCMLLALQDTLKYHQQSYVFLKGFDNFIGQIQSITYNNGFSDPMPEVKFLFDFDQRPDYYIRSKLDDLQKLITRIDTSTWVNFHSDSFFDMTQDLANDRIHPGPITNQKLAEMLINHCNQRRLLSQ